MKKVRLTGQAYSSPGDGGDIETVIEITDEEFEQLNEAYDSYLHEDEDYDEDEYDEDNFLPEDFPADDLPELYDKFISALSDANEYGGDDDSIMLGYVDFGQE